jgi:hypothetical protein
MSPEPPTLALAVVHRIRIEAYGQNVGDLSIALHRAADRMVGVNGNEFMSRGQEVYERSLKEAGDSSFAYSGRLILHPALGEVAAGDSTTQGANDG